MSNPALYAAYEAQRALLDGARAGSRAVLAGLDLLPAPLAALDPVRRVRAAYQVFADTVVGHRRRPFGLDAVTVDGVRTPVRERVVAATPFGTLRHFAVDGGSGRRPRVLVVAPLSGHFATLLTGTVRTLLADHDVFLTDWANARDVAPEHGPFGLDELVDHVLAFLRATGPRTHVMAVCQPCVPVLAAAALLAEDRDPVTPPSLTLVAGPVDVTVGATAVDTMARSLPREWLAGSVVTPVPPPLGGAGRAVYPGFLQLTGFVAMNPQRHVDAHVDLFEALVAGDGARAATIRAFYDEYLTVSDLPGEVYLDTLEAIFRDNRMARGTYTHRGRPVRPAALHRTGLLTVEGEHDDICGPGQTMAAHELCPRVPPYRRRHHLQPGVGHFGVFSGRRWESQVYPTVRAFVAAND